ncbi:MAG: ATP-binding protein [Methanosphaera stadtmanae]|nr:ATP-binding protein [Methanosphaera stadtmanae]
MPTVIPKDIDKYFYDREKYITQINTNLEMLKIDIANQFLITGYRGVGKTALTKKIISNQSDEFLTTYIDISKIFAKKKGKPSEEEILKEILKKINETLIKRVNILERTKDLILNSINKLKLKNYKFESNASILDIPLPDIEDNYNKLSEFVMELPQKIVDSNKNIKGYIIVIDEFQLIQFVENPEAFFWLIRSYTQEQYNVSYIFTGSVSKTAEIINMINGQTGAFGGRMMQIDLKPFTKEETKTYIEKYSNNIKFDEDGFNQFYNCTRGIPAYINSFCNILPNNEICTPEILKTKLLLNIDQIAILWLDVWGKLSENEKEIIKLLIEKNQLSWTEILDQTGYSKATVSKYIALLNNKGIIEFNNKKYVLTDRMLKTWLKNKEKMDGQYPE